MLCNTNIHHGFPDKMLKKSETNHRDQEVKENKVTNGNTLCREKILSEHVQNAKDKILSLSIKNRSHLLENATSRSSI